MEENEVQELLDWLQANVNGMITTPELRYLSDDSGLTEESVRLIHELPDRDWTKDQLMEEAENRARASVGRA